MEYRCSVEFIVVRCLLSSLNKRCSLFYEPFKSFVVFLTVAEATVYKSYQLYLSFETKLLSACAVKVLMKDVSDAFFGEVET